MSKAFKFWAAFFAISTALTILGPFAAPYFGNPLNSEAMAFAQGGPLGLGYDCIGRPVAPQLLCGGRELLFSALLTALLSRILAFATGLYFAWSGHKAHFIRFLLDAFLVLPMIVLSLASYQAFNGSVYAIVPTVCLLTVPFSSRYYAEIIRPVLRCDYFVYARLRDRSIFSLIARQLIPVLAKNILTDFSQAFISAIYVLSSITFLGSLANQGKFIWPAMLATNLTGFSLNPSACLAPLTAILLLTVPLGNCIDALERQEHD